MIADELSAKLSPLKLLRYVIRMFQNLELNKMAEG